jgi:hypothetical protein
VRARVGLFGFGRSVEMVFCDSKETRLEKVIRRSYKLKNRWAPEFLGVEVEEIDPQSPGDETDERLASDETQQEGINDGDRDL